jgi:hypothetical protein
LPDDVPGIAAPLLLLPLPLVLPLLLAVVPPVVPVVVSAVAPSLSVLVGEFVVLEHATDVPMPTATTT